MAGTAAFWTEHSKVTARPFITSFRIYYRDGLDEAMLGHRRDSTSICCPTNPAKLLKSVEQTGEGNSGGQRLFGLLQGGDSGAMSKSRGRRLGPKSRDGWRGDEEGPGGRGA